jgi:hypothetical protein
MSSRHNFFTGLGIIIGLALIATIKMADLVGGWINLFAYGSAALAFIAFIPWAIATHKESK